jgi:hypothetical protein
MKNFRAAKCSTKGRALVAAKILNIGDLIFSEMAAAKIIFYRNRKKFCTYCSGKVEENLSCTICLNQCYWCSVRCQNEDLIHSSSCSIMKKLTGIAGASSVDYDLLHLVIRTFFSTTTNQMIRLKKLISHSKASTHEIQESFKLAAVDLVDEFQNHEFLHHLRVVEIVEMINRVNLNSHIIHDFEDKSEAIGCGMFPITALLNHNCNPNAIYVSGENGKMEVRAIRSIDEHQELCVSYVDLFSNRLERREKLLTTKYFWCNCERCENQNDLLLNAIKCSCQIEAYYTQNSSQDFSCQSCNTELEASKAEALIKELSVDDAVKLYEGGHFQAASILFLGSLNKAKSICHPLHSWRLPIFIYLYNLNFRIHSFEKALFFLEEAIALARKIAEVLTLSSFIPEVFSYLEQRVVLLELLLAGTKEGLIEDTKDLGEKTKEALMESINYSTVCFGSR